MGKIWPRYVKFNEPWLETLAEQPCLTPPDWQMLRRSLANILSSGSREEEVQQFFEKHPHLLPGVDDYHNGPYANIVISKMPLGNDFVTDFAFVCVNSQQLQLTLVELEAPHKNLFRKDGAFSRHYVDARQQLSDWLFWAQHNIPSAVDLFAPLLRGRPFQHFDMSARAYLICGRRNDFNQPKAQQRWSAEKSLASKGLVTMTYDRVLEFLKRGPFWSFKDRILVCSYRDRSFHVQRVTP